MAKKNFDVETLKEKYTDAFIVVDEETVETGTELVRSLGLSAEWHVDGKILSGQQVLDAIKGSYTNYEKAKARQEEINKKMDKQKKRLEEYG